MTAALDPILVIAQTVFVLAALAGALTLVLVVLRRPRTVPLAVAGALLAAALIVVSVSPLNSPQPLGILIALLGVAVAVVGGDPFTRRILDIAAHGRVVQTADGGILAVEPRSDAAADAEPKVVLLRGGMTIGYLERTAAALSIVAGFPEATAVIVALKGIGRFPELATSEARERFIVGTLASLIWACAAAAVVRLSIW